MIRAAILAAATALASCAPAGLVPDATRTATAEIGTALPPARRFAGPPTLRVPVQSNAQLARDFMALTFRLETGRALPVLTRFEGPVTVAVEGTAPASLGPDLDDLVARFRREAGIDIARAAPGEMGSITISALPRATLARSVPGAACFVVPRVSGWRDYRANRFGPATDWTTLTRRTRATVFLPSDVSAQEIRDCLHEELAQALGPLGDLYRLPHSVFNDDNMHVSLTGYDMLLLRATYDPALASGMSPGQVAVALPGILARINPTGRGGDPGAVAESSAGWTRAMRAALKPDGDDDARRAAARRAVTLAQAAGWRDGRLAFSHLALGRATMAADPEAAVDAFVEAGSRYRALFGDGVHAAHTAVQLGAYAISTGRSDTALGIVDRAIPAAEEAQNASLLATLLLLRAEALDLSGDAPGAASTRNEGLAWGRYAWDDATLARRLAEVAGLGPSA